MPNSVILGEAVRAYVGRSPKKLTQEGLSSSLDIKSNMVRSGTYDFFLVIHSRS